MKSLLRSVAVLLVGFLIALPFSAAAQETCCPRTIVVPPVPMPEGESYDYGGMMASAFVGPLLVPSVIARDCPTVDFLSYEGSIVLDRLVDAFGEVSGVKPDPDAQRLKELLNGVTSDYVFLGTIEAENSQVVDGQLFGHFTLEMGLYQNCPSHYELVQQEAAMWDGSNYTIAGEGGVIGRVSEPVIENLANRFMPINQILYDYERLPEISEIVPEEEEVKTGHQIAIELAGIVDGKGRPSKPWQRVLVTVEQGEILNGVKQPSGHHVFEVGGGSVTVQYKAPDQCPEDKTDTVTVQNTCSLCPDMVINLIPEREIATKDITILCGGELEYIYDRQVSLMGADVTTRAHAMVPFYISEDGEVEGEGEGTYENQRTDPAVVVDETGTVRVTLGGKVVEKCGTAETPGIQFDISLDFEAKGTLRIPVTGFTKPTEYTDHYDCKGWAELCFPLIDGHTKNSVCHGDPFDTWILHYGAGL